MKVSGDRWEVGASVSPAEGQTWSFGFWAPVASTIAKGRVFTGAMRLGFNDAAALKRTGSAGALAGALSEVNVRVRQLEAVSAKGPGYSATLRTWRRVRSYLRSARSALRAGRRGAYQRAVHRAEALV